MLYAVDGINLQKPTDLIALCMQQRLSGLSYATLKNHWFWSLLRWSVCNWLTITFARSQTWIVESYTRYYATGSFRFIVACSVSMVICTILPTISLLLIYSQDTVSLFSRALSRSLRSVRTLDVMVVTGYSNAQLGCLAETERYHRSPISIPAGLTNNHDRLSQVCSHRRLVLGNTNFCRGKRRHLVPSTAS